MLYHKSIGYLSDCVTLFYLLHPPSLTQAVTAVSGKLVLAKYVHSENEKEEEEHVFLLFFAEKKKDRVRGGGLCGKNSQAVTAMPGK